MKKTCHKGKLVYIGIDVHKRTYSITALGDHFRGLKVGSMPAVPTKLVQYIKKTFEGAIVKSACEAGCTGYGLHRTLVQSGIDNLVVHPASIEVAMNNRVKTDVRDSARIAQQLKNNALTANKVPEKKDELQRTLIRTRFQLRKELTRTGIQIKSKMLQYGLIAHDDDRIINRKRIKEYLALDLPDELRFCLESMQRVFTVIAEELSKIQIKIKDIVDGLELAPIYLSVPGVGYLTTAVLNAELGDMSRFSNTRQLGSFIGLTPSEWSSGNSVRRGSTTKQGNSLIRYLLVEASWAAIRKDSGLAEIYNKIKIRRGGKRAIVAVARHLAIKLRACLMKRELYHS